MKIWIVTDYTEPSLIVLVCRNKKLIRDLAQDEELICDQENDDSILLRYQLEKGPLAKLEETEPDGIGVSDAAAHGREIKYWARRREMLMVSRKRRTVSDSRQISLL